MDETKSVYRDYVPMGKGSGIFKPPEGLRVLEIGFGGGELLKVLRDAGNDVYGIDVSESLVKEAKVQGFENTTHLDISDSPLPYEEDFFDAVFAYEVFEHLTNPHRMFYEVRRVLKAGSLLYFSVPAQEVDMGYGVGRHTFVYPGLLERKNLERFFMQMYFRIEESVHPGPKDFFHGHNYTLRNMKRAGQADVVQVIVQDASVQDLYGHFLDPEVLAEEMKREAESLVDMIEYYVRNDLWSVALMAMRFTIEKYPHHYPIYPPIGKTLIEHGHLSQARSILAIARGMEKLPVEVRAEIDALLSALDGRA